MVFSYFHILKCTKCFIRSPSSTTFFYSVYMWFGTPACLSKCYISTLTDNFMKKYYLVRKTIRTGIDQYKLSFSGPGWEWKPEALWNVLEEFQNTCRKKKNCLWIDQLESYKQKSATHMTCYINYRSCLLYCSKSRKYPKARKGRWQQLWWGRT